MDIYKSKKPKYFSILGDSISTLEGYSEPKNAEYYLEAYMGFTGVITPKDTWWGRVIDRLSGELLVNNSISGSTASFHPEYQVPSYGCSDERTSSLGRGELSPDVIMVFLGINDWGMGLRVRKDERGGNDTENLCVFSDAYKSMLRKLKGNYPQAEIWCLTLPISRCSAKENFEFPYYYAGRHISEYCEAIRKAAKEYDCQIIDLYQEAEPHDTVDGFHPTASGMKTIADVVLASCEK